MPNLPQIQQYTPQTAPQGAASFNPRMGEASIGPGLEALGSGLTVLQQTNFEIEKKHREQDAATWSIGALGQMQSTWDQEFEDRKQQAAPGAPDFSKNLISDFDKQAAKQVEQAPTQASKQFMQERLLAFRRGLLNESMHFEAASRTANNMEVAKSSVDDARSEVQNQPENFATRLAERNALIEQMRLSPADKGKLLTYAQKSLAHDATVGLINQNPYTALKAINSKGPSGITAIDALAPDDRLVLRNTAEAEIHRREALARQNADRAEAIGYRAVGEMDRQISSGIPATAQMWADWQADTKGTPYESMFKERLADEQEVQGVLRKPIDEQVKYVQDKQSKLETEGGDLHEAANVQKLRAAVTQNLKTLQQTPLLYSQNRTGTPPPPVDLNALADPNGAQALSQAFAQRADIVDGLRQKLGDQVGYHLLLPQEAAQLGAIVDQASPKQASQVLSTLRNAAGSDQAFTSMMQQIAPDSPVRAFAGLIASRQRSLVVQSHIFSPDVSVQSGDVAATLLQGEALLDPSKQAKSQDGKPKTSLYLPETTELQARFQDQVGAAFAGYPGAAQTAFQAVKAYYVGKAASTGLLAANNKDINSSLVKEAVTATLGAVVDYNGRGEVIAPWGMDKSQFGDSVEQAFSGVRGKINWPDNHPLALSELGLKPAGADSYFLTAGRGFLTDKTGMPVTLKLTDPANNPGDSSPVPARKGRGVDR